MPSKHARRGTRAWRIESAAAIPPAADETLKQIEQAAMMGLGHEHTPYGPCCLYDNQHATDVLALIARLRRAEQSQAA